QLSVAALGRHEAAHRDRAHARIRSLDPADGRAIRRPRRADAQPDAGRAAWHLAAHAQDRDLRHARRERGGASRRSRCGDVGAARTHQDDRGDGRRPRRSQPFQVEGLRRQSRRDLEFGARRSDQGAGNASAMTSLFTKSALTRYLPLLLIALAWEIAPRIGFVSRLALPPLSAVALAWVDLLRDGGLITNGASSPYRAGAGLGLAIVIGAVLGIVMAWWRPVNALLSPLVELFYPMPKSALIPVTVLWLGFSDGSKILLIFLGCMLPVTIGAFNGARG